MGVVEKSIKNKVFRIHDSITELLPNVDGMLSEKMLNQGLLGSLYRAVRSLEPFVNINIKPSEKEYTEVDFNTDLIVMRTKDYEDMIQQIKVLEQEIDVIDG